MGTRGFSNQSNFLITKLSRVLHPMNKEKPDSIIQTILHYYNTEEVKRGEDVAGDSIHANISDMFHIGKPIQPIHIAIVRLGTYVTISYLWDPHYLDIELIIDLFKVRKLFAYDAVLREEELSDKFEFWGNALMNMLAVKKFILGGKGITFLS
ncbi:hypothetical protein ACJX0J_000373 (mitochondrion) [Zea mays]